VAAGRVGIGAALLADPARFGRPWLGAPAETAGGGVAVRALGARDLALGAVTLAALTGRLHGSTAPALVAASGFCDLADGVALHRARKDVPAVGNATGAFAFGSALLGFALARKLHAGS
jgi:hypothetical protein